MVVFLVLQSIVNTLQSNWCFELIFKPEARRGIKISKNYWGTYNIRAAVSEQMCRDISGACGQLVVNLIEGTKEFHILSVLVFSPLLLVVMAIFCWALLCKK
jgi:hypothetical protein